MLIHEPRPDLERVKEVKVKIPIGMHIKLHSMKVLTGKQISDAVTEALTVYFQHNQDRLHGEAPVPVVAPALGVDDI